MPDPSNPLPEELIAQIHSASLSEPEGTLLRAMSTATDWAVKAAESDDLQIPGVILALLKRLNTDTRPRVVNQAMIGLSRLKAVSGVMALIDVALGQQVALFENDGVPTEFSQSDEALRIRCTAIQTLGRIRDERALVPLMGLLNNPTVNYRVRLAAAESLGKIGDPGVVSPLMDILVDEDEKSVYLKESAAKALGMVGDQKTLEPLIDLLKTKQGIQDKFDFLKEQVIQSIGRIMGRSGQSRKGTDTLIAALSDATASVRLAAVEALGETADRDCLAPLKEVLFDPEDDVALAAVAAIFALGGEAVMLQLRELENLPQFVRDEIESYIP